MGRVPPFLFPLPRFPFHFLPFRVLPAAQLPVSFTSFVDRRLLGVGRRGGGEGEGGVLSVKFGSTASGSAWDPVCVNMFFFFYGLVVGHRQICDCVGQ